jgi:hypothetical protein
MLCKHGEPIENAPRWCVEETAKENEMTEEDKQVNLFGVMTNFKMPNEDTPKFSLEAKVWKELWNWDGEPQELKVTSTHGYRLNDWHDDIDGGPGLCIVVEFDSPRGKPYNTQVIIPKDELIKALGLLVGDGTE